MITDVTRLEEISLLLGECSPELKSEQWWDYAVNYLYYLLVDAQEIEAEKKRLEGEA